VLSIKILKLVISLNLDIIEKMGFLSEIFFIGQNQVNTNTSMIAFDVFFHYKQELQ